MPPGAGDARPKSTAEGVAALRAAGAREKDPLLRNPDSLAINFLNPAIASVVRLAPLRRLALRAIQRRLPGSYFFHTARTRHIDSILHQGMKDGMQQIVILGAGYDSRAYRFEDLLRGAHVFELDYPATQARKKAKLKQLFGEVPEHVTLAPIDFNTDRLGERLSKSGYDPTRKTLFIWEGVSMYVSPQGVDQTLGFIAGQSAPGSWLLLEYVYRSVIDGTCDYYGARQAAAYVAKRGEPYLFGIEEGQTAAFLGERGFELISDFSPSLLEQTYLAAPDGTLPGRVHGYSSLALGRVIGSAAAPLP